MSDFSFFVFGKIGEFKYGNFLQVRIQPKTEARELSNPYLWPESKC